MRQFLTLLLFVGSLAFAQDYFGANDAQPIGAPDPPNEPCVWLSTPDPTFQQGVAASYDIAADFNDPDGDTIELAEEAGCIYPTGVTLNDPTDKLDASTGTTEGTTTGCVLSCKDPTHSKVNSSAFPIVIGGPPGANIIWEAHYENTTYEYLDWHGKTDQNHPHFGGIPAYGRPTVPAPNNTSAVAGYFGDGSLMEFVTSPVRCGTNANKITVKNSANGSEPADCDNGNCTRRRSELNHHLILYPDQGDMAYLTEYWMTLSIFIPADWDDGGSGFGPTVYQVKAPTTNQISPTLAIEIAQGNWSIWHRVSDATNPSSDVDIPWQKQMFFAGGGSDAGGQCYPRSGLWPDGLAFFPNEANSCAALQNLNKGGWTDFVFNVLWDGRGVAEGGTGKLDLWVRASAGSWVKVLAIVPTDDMNRGSTTFDMGIGYRLSGSGFGPLAGIYMDKNEVWGRAANRVAYNDCLKIGNSSATFSDMSPDGSSP